MAPLRGIIVPSTFRYLLLFKFSFGILDVA